MGCGFNVIFVPHGQEYQAVLQGLKQVKTNAIQVVPIPIGSKSLKGYLKQWINSKDCPDLPEINVLVLGLCGSLSPQYRVGDIVIYQDCLRLSQTNIVKECDRNLTLFIKNKLKTKVCLVHALTSDKVIISAAEKQHLGQVYSVDVVDMEGFLILDNLADTKINIAMVRVVSDEVNQNLPDLKEVISSEGRLNFLRLGIAMFKRPIAAFYLIKSSLKSLEILKQVTMELFRI